LPEPISSPEAGFVAGPIFFEEPIFLEEPAFLEEPVFFGEPIFFEEEEPVFFGEPIFFEGEPIPFAGPIALEPEPAGEVLAVPAVASGQGATATVGSAVTVS
jgi:hypothetical protein